MLLTLVSLIAFAPTSGDVFHCVKTGDAYTKPAEVIDYKGVRYGTCCGGCGPMFEKDPEGTLKETAGKGLLVGTSLFDPVSGARIKETSDEPSSIYKGVKYFFANAGEKTTFDAAPARYTTAPAKELLHCPMQNADIKSYASAGGYVDYGGVRYYVCCADCLSMMHKDPASHTSAFADKATTAKPEEIKSK